MIVFQLFPAVSTSQFPHLKKSQFPSDSFRKSITKTQTLPVAILESDFEIRNSGFSKCNYLPRFQYKNGGDQAKDKINAYFCGDFKIINLRLQLIDIQ